jgi:SEC-C motif domain protein
MAKPCPCHSGATYKQCCEAYHKGAALPDHPEALMRSRYSAYALGFASYLQQTLANDHPDKGAPDFAQSIASSKQRLRYMGLRIENSTTDANETHGQVLFHARIFEKGQDRSFRELSTFAKESGEWRYVSGHILRGNEIDS